MTRAERRRRREERRHRQDLAIWQEDHDRLGRELALVRSGGLSDHPLAPAGLALVRGERPIAAFDGVRLIETGPGTRPDGRRSLTERLRDTWQRVMTPIRSVLAPGILARRTVDTGALTVTDRRIVFSGARLTREWPLDRIARVTHFDHPPWTALETIDGPALAGFGYGRGDADDLRLRLKVALALVDGRQAEVAEGLRRALEEHAAERPVPGQRPKRPLRTDSPWRIRITVESEVAHRLRVIGLVAVVCGVILGVAWAATAGGGRAGETVVVTAVPTANTPCPPNQLGVSHEPGTPVELTCTDVAAAGPTWVWTPPMAGAPCRESERGLVAAPGTPDALVCEGPTGDLRWASAPGAS